MQAHRLTDQLSVAAQIDAEDIATIAAAGFRSIVNNRPDNEVPGQPDNAELAAAAQQAGLGWRYLPVPSGQFTEAQVREFAAALDELARPVLAFCRSGTRCSALWALQAAGSADDVLATARTAGYDLSMLRSWLERSERAR
ncbi:MAG: TIGR01244 family sulfur transferase [Rhodanobacter sp.]